MPELPEVETVVRDLQKRVVGRKILDVWTDWPKYFKGMSLAQFKKHVVGKKIVGVSRRGKNILIEISGSPSHEASKGKGEKIVTEVKPLEKFYEAEAYHKDFYTKNPNQPYCQLVISPKLEKLKEKFYMLLKN